jgi:hypothetical protein
MLLIFRRATKLSSKGRPQHFQTRTAARMFAFFLRLPLHGWERNEMRISLCEAENLATSRAGRLRRRREPLRIAPPENILVQPQYYRY